LESIVLGDKVVVFTRRPGTIKTEISVNYKRPRLPEDESLRPYYRQVIDSIKSEIIDRKSSSATDDDEDIT
jgi:NitT/TauT family transport system ATP-binding protein